MGLLNVGLQMARSALAAQQLALEVTGNNIANANTDSYARRRVQMVSRPDIDLGSGLKLGSGVGVAGIQRVVDDFLDGRLRQANADCTSLDLQRQTLQRLEGLYGELGDADLSTMMNEFFNALDDLRNFPDEPAQRQLLVSLAQNLTEQFQMIRRGITDVRTSLDLQYRAAVQDVNSLTEQIAALNTEIIRTEGGGLYHGTAASLRDERDDLLRQLSDLVSINVVEQQAGGADVWVGSHLLVTDRQHFELRVETASDFDRDTGRWITSDQADGPSEVLLSYAVFDIDNTELQTEGGMLHGLLYSRDDILATQADTLDRLVSNLVWEFNKVHSEGCGLAFFEDVTSVDAVTDADATLSSAGLSWSPVNGSFNIRVHDTAAGLVKTVNIQVDLDGIGTDDTLNTLVTKINSAMTAAGLNVSAAVNTDNTLSITSGATDTRFSFNDDTSNVLAALGINTFFTGDNALNVGINERITGKIDLVAGALTPTPADGTNAGRLAQLRTLAIDALGGLSLEEYHQSCITDLAIETSLTKSRSDGAAAYMGTLQAERDAVSGVNLDEEAINLLRYQRAYQAAARYVTVIDEMVKTILAMI
ncbi:MAG TPA: flagellar hook-associated protein FlgK [Planctomycetota bacterium]|nr:flagellar hook-associated protein FlgK [Planctomycetota bacterium]